MAKTSIFSKDYEKIMRKRKKRLRIIYFISFLAVILLFVKIIKYNFTDIQHRVENWVYKQSDSADSIIDNKPEEHIDIIEEEKEEIEEKKIEEKIEEKISVAINNINLNLILKEEQGVKSIVNIENKPENYYSILSKDSKNVLIIDDLQNIYLVKSNGEVNNLTLDQYIAPDGEKFEKNNTITTYNGYLWHSNAKFLSDNKIAYITNIPYFGYNLNQYVSIINVENKSHQIIWNVKGKNISFGEFDGKRLKVIIDGNITYIDENGEETS